MYRVLLILFCSACFQLKAQEILKKPEEETPLYKIRRFEPSLEVKISGEEVVRTGCHRLMETRERYILGAIGLSYARQIEERLSPLVYSGFGFTGNVGYEKIRRIILQYPKPARVQRYLFSMGNYALSNPVSTPLMNARIYSTKLGLQYQNLKRVNESNKNDLEIFVGGAVGILGLNRFHGNFYNNANAYTWFAGLSGCGEIHYPFEAFKRNWRLIVQGQVGLAGLRLQQAYGSMWSEGFLEPGTKTIPGTINSIKGTGFWNFLSSNWGWHIRYYLEKRNFISLGTVSAFHSSPGEGQTKFRLSETGIQLGGGFEF
jgi:hypothetical protein